MFKGRLIQNTKISEGLHLLRFERLIDNFISGQHIDVATHSDHLRRAYSICSGENDPYIEILLKVVPRGLVSTGLSQLKKGDPVFYSEASGYFNLKKNNRIHYFIANGSGIAPFLSFIKTNKDIANFDYHLIHGLSSRLQYNKLLEIGLIPDNKYISCTSKDHSGFFSGRLTNYLEQSNLPSANYYLCGNIEMIYNVMDILKSKNIDDDQILSEVYY